MRPVRLILVMTLACLACACGDETPEGGGDAPPGTADGAIGGGGHTTKVGASDEAVTVASDPEAGAGLSIELSDGAPGGDGAAAVPVAKAKPLPEDALAQLLERLPPVGAKAGDTKDFALRAGSKPPPLTGRDVRAAWPPKGDASGGPGEVEDKPLEVLRFQPEGDVPIAPKISVTFNQPMVPVTSHAELSAEQVPVRVSPEPPGTWRWVGTRTLLFEPGERFPMATEYKVEVPAGVKSVAGKPLEKAVKWSFVTPPPQVRTSYPTGDDVETDPVFLLVFDQRIDAAKILENVSVAAGSKTFELKRLDEEALKARREAERKDQRTPVAIRDDWKERWVAFQAVEKLPTDTQVKVSLNAGTPSAEGPLKTTEPFTWSFKTYGPFDVKRHRCGWGSECRPLMPLQIELTNRVDEQDFDPALVKVEPAIPGMVVEAVYRGIRIRGATRGRTDYEVTLSPDIRDVYGQKLGETDTLEFEVGKAESVLGSPVRDPMVVIEPKGKPKFNVYATNFERLKVKLWKVAPSDWGDFLEYQRNWRRNDKAKMPGEKVFDAMVDTKIEPDVLTEVPIDLSKALADGKGQVVLMVQPDAELKEWEMYRNTVLVWVQVTGIGLDAFTDAEEMIAFATRLSDGAPMGDVSLEIVPSDVTGKTGADGIARLKLPASAPARQALIARQGSDMAFLPDSRYAWSTRGAWMQRDRQDSLRWFVFDDRKLYKPKETVRLKGWIRVVEAGEKGDIAALKDVERVTWRARGPRGNDIAKGEAKLTGLGGFDLKFDLPDSINLGTGTVDLTAVVGGKSYSLKTTTHRFEIQEFRRPEFEVSASAEKGPHLVGGKATVSIAASYFAGGPLPNAEVTWSVNTSPGGFRPPNTDGYSFGTWVPWWESRSSSRGRSSHKSLKGRTGADGKHHLEIAFPSVDPPRPTVVTASGTVMDVNRQAWSASTSLLVHPADRYVGLKTSRAFVEAGTPIDVDAIVTDLDGNRVADVIVTMRAVRLQWKRVKGQWKMVEAGESQCEKLSSASDPIACSFPTDQGGRYRIVARIKDKRGRDNESTLTVWVPGGDRPRDNKLEQESVTVVPNAETYQPGDTAEFLVQAPFWPAEGVATVRRDGIATTERFKVDGPSTTLKVKIESWQVPGFRFQVNLAGSAERLGADGKPDPKLPRRPAYAEGGLYVRVPPKQRALAVEVAPAASELSPGAQTKLTLTVKGPDGKPVQGAEVAVVVVDEAVLALTGYQIADPLGAFYLSRGPGASDFHLRDYVRLSALDDLLAQAQDQMDDAEAEEAKAEAPTATASPKRRRSMAADKAAPGGGGGEGPKPIAVRKDFSALALFAPDVTTDADGRAVLDMKLPDNLTRYRVTAVAVHGDNHFGKGESAITARLPLMVRISAPRFLNFGDRFELPVVLQNQTDAAMDVDVAVRVTNAELTDGSGRRLKVPANDRVEVRFPTAAQMAGTARFQVGAAAGEAVDASEVALPVWTPATTEAFATYGTVDKGGVAQPVRKPGEVWDQFGGLEVQTSSTALQALTDAVLYLVAYPFECAEQRASRVLAVAALRDVLTAFEADGMPSPEAMVAAVKRDITRLKGMQNSDGGFAFWRRGQESWPFVTLHVTHALVRAKAKGFEVPSRMLSNAMGYLKTIERHFPSHYSPAVRRTLRAYAVYVRALEGDRDVKEAKALVSEWGGLDKVGLEAVGWLYPVVSGEGGDEALTASIRKLLANRATETAATAHFVTSYDDGAHLILHSDRRADALLLEGLIKDQPKSDLIPKLVRGLLDHRTKGRWGSTQENAWVLLSLDRYFNTYENVTPNFVARVWLGEQFAGEHKFKGRTTERHHVDIPMKALSEVKGGKPDLILTKEGPGRMYYRIGMRYAPKSLKLDPSDHGFTVERSYFPVDEPDEVTRGDDGVWKVKAGARVRVRVTMVAPERRYHVALVDPLPAGFEPLNPKLRGAEPPPQQASPRGTPSRGRYGRGYRWWGPWYEHDNLRDERAEAFSSLVWSGVYTYEYIARATTPGEFVVPPPKAEEMYHPETFGRGASDRVIVQ